jgi:hypothetical protein
MSKNLRTYTGIRIEEVPSLLAKPFSDPKAYRPIPGSPPLTDINTGFMLERVTQVFGLKGVGWNFLFTPENMEISYRDEDHWVSARLRYAELVINFLDEKDEVVTLRIPTSGASTNEPGFAEEGARTSALGSALKGMCFQLGVYKGEMDITSSGLFFPLPPTPTQLPFDSPLPAVKKETGMAFPPDKPIPPRIPVEHSGDYVVDVGAKHMGKKLSELSSQALTWYASLDGKGMSPANQKARELQEQACRYLAEKMAIKG